MKHRVLLQLGIPLLILCALFLLLAYPADRTLRPQPLLEVSVILRETDCKLWTMPGRAWSRRPWTWMWSCGF